MPVIPAPRRSQFQDHFGYIVSSSGLSHSSRPCLKKPKAGAEASMTNRPPRCSILAPILTPTKYINKQVNRRDATA